MTSFIDLPRLPTIDLSLFDIGDPWRDHVAAQVDWAASTFGLFQIVGHGVDRGLIDALLDLGGKYLGRGGDPRDDLPGFRDTVREYTTIMTGLGHKLMTTMARGLRLDDSFFVDRYSGNPVTSLRIRDRPVSWAGTSLSVAETDDGAERELLTIVKLSETEGQQVRLEGRWVDVPALPGALLCYVGPVLEHLTAGHYVSAAHRLSLGNGSSLGSGSSPGNAANRPSVSFAFQPAPHAVLTPVAGMSPRPAEAGSSSRYAFEVRC
jgi:isopenicillin N synthase-like dioxygenase